MSGDLESFLRQAAARKSSPSKEEPRVLSADDIVDEPVTPYVVEDVEVVEVIPPARSSFPASTSLPSDRKLSETRSLERNAMDKVDYGDVEYADERMEAHLHDVFDHQIGSLSQEPTSTDDMMEERARSKKPKLDIVGMFRSTELRKIVIINEIMKRPEW